MSDRWWLVIEDDEVDVMTIQRGMRELGHPIDLAVVPNGFSPVDQLRACQAEQQGRRPELIVIDINLPLASGHEVLARLREDRDACTIPVVVLTTSDQQSDIDAAYRAGAAGYFVKSADFSSFVKMLSAIVDYWSVAQRA